MLKIHEHFPCSCSALCFSVSALSHLLRQGVISNPNLLKPPELFLLQFAYCCIINHLRVSGVTQGPVYLAHRLSVCQEFGCAVLLLQCLGPQLGRLTKLEGDVKGWEWNPLWRFFTHVWRLGCEFWTAGSAGIVGWTTSVWPLWAWASHIEPLGSKTGRLETQNSKRIRQGLLGPFWPDLGSCPLSLPLHSVGYNGSLRTAQIQGEGNLTLSLGGVVARACGTGNNIVTSVDNTAWHTIPIFKFMF